MRECCGSTAKGMVGGAVVQALHGEIGMSSDLDELGAALYNGTLPSQWARKAPQTQKKLASWMVHFERRDRQYRDGGEVGRRG